MECINLLANIPWFSYIYEKLKVSKTKNVGNNIVFVSLFTFYAWMFTIIIV